MEQASEANHDIAVLFKDIDSSSDCSHEIPWRTDQIVELQRCPECGESVGMVCDALAASRERNGNCTAKTNRIIRFKFGKKVYQLSVQNLRNTMKEEENNRDSNTWLKFFMKRPTTKVNNRCIRMTMLVQDRIVEALDLDSIKILHKGKILYTSRSDTHFIEEQDADISNKLLEISNESWYSSNTRGTKKVPLVVMGTRKADQLREPLRSSKQIHSGIWKRLQQSVWLPVTIFRWSITVSWAFVKSIFEPFTTAYIEGMENASNNGRRNRRTRSHHD